MDKIPRKHAELIKAWADGAEIQFQRANGTWAACSDGPRWYDNDVYRIKPEPKPDTVITRIVCRNSSFTWTADSPDGISAGSIQGTVNFIFDGETGKLKSGEVIPND